MKVTDRTNLVLSNGVAGEPPLEAEQPLSLSHFELDQRIGQFASEPGYPVHTAWDIGHGDDMAIWCFQVMPGVVRLVGYYVNSGEGMPHYLDYLEVIGERGWTYGKHYLPADVRVHDGPTVKRASANEQ